MSRYGRTTGGERGVAPPPPPRPTGPPPVVSSATKRDEAVAELAYAARDVLHEVLRRLQASREE